MILSTPLFSFNFDFSLPPVVEEVFEPSVLGEEIQAPKKRVQRPQTPTQMQEKDRPRRIDDTPTDIYVTHQEEFETELEPSPDLSFASYPRIALLVPRKVIGKYANSISDTILSYLIYKDQKFQFELFDSKDESEASIRGALRKIHQKGYQLVIAPVTKAGARVIVKYEHNLLVYVPTINKKEINLMSENIFFGGIDYEEQIDRLLSHSGDKVAIFGDKSALSHKLENYVDNASFSEIAYRKVIANAKANLSPFIKNNRKLKDASIFLNMPIVKSSLLASQLNVHEAKHKNVLLTQISYNPLLFTLTQAQDRKKMFLANSINHTVFELKDTNLILGTNLDFSWVNYATTIGLDYLVRNYIDSGSRKIFSEKMVNNQIRYDIEILKPENASFVKVREGF
jgi:SRSO17 transposase